MIYVSIDFSLNSSGITILHDGKYHFLSYYNDVKSSKSNISALDVLMEANNFHIRRYKRSAISAPNNRGDGIDGWEREHIGNCIYYGQDIVEFIKCAMHEICGEYDAKDVTIILENYSYSSQSNTLIQIVENTMVLKYHLFQHFCIDNFYIIPAPKVKSFVGSGSFDKYDMLKAFMSNNRGGDHFMDIVSKNEDVFLKHKMKNGRAVMEVLSPIQDIVDSYWMLQYFLHIQQKQLS